MADVPPKFADVPQKSRSCSRQRQAFEALLHLDEGLGEAHGELLSGWTPPESRVKAAAYFERRVHKEYKGLCVYTYMYIYTYIYI